MQLPDGVTIRLASKEDREAILPLMVRFKNESAYKDLPTEEDVILTTIDAYISKINNKDCTVVVSIKDSTLVGIIVGTATTLPFNNLIQAAETVWYVVPEYRDTNIGYTLWKAFEYWATEKVGANVVHTASPYKSKLKKIYLAEGYKPLEEVFIKVI